MPRKYCLILALFFFLVFSTAPTAFAIEDPLVRPNNKIGIHILFTTEIPQAAKLTNSSGGDWGYVTIPIQSTDHDKKKWQNFMNYCKKYHIIPILRLATTGDLTDSTVWKKPQINDIIDFATFLNTLSWPTENRYIIVFNEVNRADEWGGSVNPAEYANILSFAVTVFKSKSPDFFIISSGLDNAAPAQGTKYMNEYEFMREMSDAVPALFNQIDGLASHSYPNPGFSQPPSASNPMGVASFKYERDLVKDLTGKSLPVFITETGWSDDTVTDTQKVQYYQNSFDTIWNDPGIVAITPFILEARGGVFGKFSFLISTGSASKQYEFVQKMIKIKGTPSLPVKVLAAQIVKPTAVKKDTSSEQQKPSFFPNLLNHVVKWFNG